MEYNLIHLRREPANAKQVNRDRSFYHFPFRFRIILEQIRGKLLYSDRVAGVFVITNFEASKAEFASLR